VVETEQGTITCEHVVNAGGTYARQMGEWSGLQLPMTSMTHHYFVTDEVPEFRDLDRELPVIRDDRKVSGYIRMEQKKGLIGIYEKANPNTSGTIIARGRPRTSCSRPTTTGSCRGWRRA
jgi:dimethylglycine dehydrogenase